MSEVSHGTTTLTNCRFIGNRAVLGGGMYSRSGSMPILTNCMFVGNSADLGGATSHFGLADATYTKCTFAANSALHGYAILCTSRENAYPSNVQLKSCIIWDGGEEIWNSDNSVITITYSDVYGTWPGEGNIDEDPCFADANNGDYHLKSQVGRWEPNSQQWVQDDVTSPCIDAGNPADPVGHEPFPNGGIINMGAYGGTAEASKSYFGEPVCEIVIAGDINGDCRVDWKDFALMALHWLEYIKRPPVVYITNPQDGTIIYSWPVEIRANAWDLDGSVVKVEFFAGRSKIGEDNDGSDGWQVNWQDYPSGDYSLTARAIDDSGMSATSPPVEVRVIIPR